VRLALPKNPVFYLPAYLARELGYFKEEGLSVEIQDLPGGSRNIQAMLGGSSDVIGAVYEHTLWLAAEKRATRCFVLFIVRPGLMLMVSPAAAQSLKTIADLKGRNVGVATIGSQSHFFVNYILDKNGLAPEDIKVVAIGMGAAAVAALERGLVDAAAITGSGIAVLQRRHPDMGILANGCTAEGVKELFGLDIYPTHGLLAPDDWLNRNPLTAGKLAKAVLQANRWIREHSPEEILEKLPAEYRMEDAAADIDAIRMAISMLSVDGQITRESAEAARRVLSFSMEKVRTSDFDITSTYTNEFVQGA
jgi:NitT/TauT family transport system substrate-binding protein